MCWMYHRLFNSKRYLYFVSLKYSLLYSFITTLVIITHLTKMLLMSEMHRTENDDQKIAFSYIYLIYFRLFQK